MDRFQHTRRFHPQGNNDCHDDGFNLLRSSRLVFAQKQGLAGVTISSLEFDDVDGICGQNTYPLTHAVTAELEPVRQYGSGPAGSDKTGRKVEPARTKPDFCQFMIFELVLIFYDFLWKKHIFSEFLRCQVVSKLQVKQIMRRALSENRVLCKTRKIFPKLCFLTRRTRILCPLSQFSLKY